MAKTRAAAQLLVTDRQRAELAAIAGSPSLSYRVVRQARGLLDAVVGVGNEEIGRRCGVSANTVRAWRASFARTGVEGVGMVASGRGRKPWLPEGTVAEVVRATLHERPDGTSTHWTTRTLAKRMGIGKDTVAGIWRDHELRPWKVDTSKISNDPLFEEKLIDVVGLYLDPPDRAVVFSFDEKALDRTQPSLPMIRGRAGTMTHDYRRNGTTDLFAALDIATGEVVTACRTRHTAADVLAFFKTIDRSVPRWQDIHVVLDNLSAHKAPETQDWLAHPRRARWHLHFTPTSSSWLDLVQRWSKELTDRRLRRGTFTSVPVLIEAIQTWVSHRSQDPKPFIWHAAADETLEKVRRAREALSQVKSATQH